jgi:hypothetical protein
MIIVVMLVAPMISGLMAVMPRVLQFQPVIILPAARLLQEPDKPLAAPDITVPVAIKPLVERMLNGLTALTLLVLMFQLAIILRVELLPRARDKLNVRRVPIVSAGLSPELVRLVIIVRPEVPVRPKMLAVLEPLTL